MQLLLLFEAESGGASIDSFNNRFLGVILGGIIGLISCAIVLGNRVAVVAFLAVGAILFFYIQFSRPDQTGFTVMGSITMSVVALSTVSGDGTLEYEFYCRVGTFIVAGLVAQVLVQLS
ncbi:hypothetical protein FVEN_g4111 [Fusarium venenatum]|uniref:uncharacterized protein n=1 Tax=Fusarium venenatum TaxID=56646 RepID=UPI001D827891|nr:hypothetical protein FVEN_g4111 [Fusarium venenatum]KAH6965901.1 hypothetical protein EDB82DRAFT_315722 [Fusarium venenatum]